MPEKKLSPLEQSLKESLEEIRRPNELVADIKLPNDLLIGFMAGRPELIKLAKPRPLNEEECAAVYHALEVLLRTNIALQRHSHLCGELADHIYSSLVGLSKHTDSLRDFGHFRESVSDVEEMAEDDNI